jgi:hypothetical protein
MTEDGAAAPSAWAGAIRIWSLSPARFPIFLSASPVGLLEGTRV